MQKYIHAFGGDPNSVTIFGQSAGATSTIVHLLSPKSQGLFHRAIIQSDPATLPLKNLKSAHLQGNQFLKFTNTTDDIQALRKLDVNTIVQAQIDIDKTLNLPSPLETFLPWTPLIDNDDVIDNPLYAAQQLRVPKNIPVMIGGVTNEALLFIYEAAKKKVTDAEYIAVIGLIFGLQDGAKVLQKYPPPVFGDKRPALGYLGSDYVMLCSIRNVTENLANANPENVWLYHYDHAESFDIWGPNYTECPGKVCHGADLLLLWGTAELQPGIHYTPQEQELVNLMIDYWTNFAKSGNPNIGNPVPNWPAYSKKYLQNMRFKTPKSEIEKGWRGSECEFFDQLGYHHGWHYPEQY